MATDEVRKDLRAAVAARQELGPEYENELIDSFLEKLDARDAHRRGIPNPYPGAAAPAHPRREPDPGGLALAIVSVVVAIPITAIMAGMIGLPGVLIGWLGLLGINFARTMARRR
jgi:hypothetical protein